MTLKKNRKISNVGIVGRKTKYKDDFPERVRKMAEGGMIQADMYKALDVSHQTFHRWVNEKSEFCEALKAGKNISDEIIESALFKRAVGYSHEDVHISNYQGKITVTDIIKHYPPDPTSMIFWLKNRRPDEWRDRHEIDVNDKRKYTNEERADKIIGLLQRGGNNGTRRVVGNGTVGTGSGK